MMGIRISFIKKVKLIYLKFKLLYYFYMKIGNVEIKNNLILAPMAGYTDVGFRKLCKDFGAGLTCTEMISAKGLMYDSEKTKELLYTEKEETPTMVQLFGHEPFVMAESCNHPLIQKFDIIDINMGCPAPKITKNKEGSYLLKDIDNATRIVEECVKSSGKPITVKLRLGYDDENVALSFAKNFESVGVSAVTIHGRTKNQMYSGKANYEEIAKIKRELNIPVIANGDVVDLKSYKQIVEITKADFVMIGRGAIGNPHIFADILNNHKPFNKFECINEHIRILKKYYNDKFILLNMRKHIACYLKNMGLSSEQKLKILTLDDLDELIKECKNIFC